ncbi:hypothetical protein ANTQUA_LOCUS9221 [Anthophora quadrimaculata]
MDNYPSKIQSIHEEMIDYGFPSRTVRNEVIVKRETIDRTRATENEILGICQALLLSTCVLLLSYYSVRYGRTEYSIMENGEIIKDYTNKAVLTVVLGHSVTYSVLSMLATGMLAYSLVSKNPHWSLPSIVLYLDDLVYDVSSATVAIWLFFSNLPLETALSYTIGTILLIIGEIWIWIGVLQLYEQRTFK